MKLCRNRICFAFFLAILSLVFAAIGAESGPIGKVSYFTSWDDNYFYAAIHVQDFDVVGTEKSPNSAPWKDDDIEVFIERDFKRAAVRTNNTFQIALSPAGGTSFLVGDGGRAKPKSIFSYKCAFKIHGTLNKSDDLDEGFDAELAVPWTEMGGPPIPGTPMGFNIVCRSRNGEFASLSPDVKTEEDINNPSKWSEIKFIGPAVFAMTTGTHRAICTKSAARPPFIDGAIGKREWNPNTSFSMGTELKPVVPSPSAPPSQTQRLVLTHYFYWYQGDPRKEAGFAHVRYLDGSSQLTDHPIRGVGPWFTYDRASWHEAELQDIRRAGIDVILPIYWGSAAYRRGFASKGLDCMVQALYNLKAEGKEYPLVGMFFDTSGMAGAYGGRSDLRQEEVKRSFYGMIRDFFLRIPPEFRAVAPINPAKNNTPGYIVVLYTAAFFEDFDASFIDYCNRRFAEDFNGASVLWVGGSDFKSKAPNLDGYCSYGAGLGLKYDPDGRLKIAGVGAGYDDSAVRGRTTPIRSRKDGDTYKADWAAALNKNLDWVILDGWNELHEGSDICASRQYGYKYVDLTSIHTLKFRAFRDYLPAFVRHNTPAVMVPGSLYQIDVAVRNSGMKPWRAGENYALTYRWYKNGELISNGASRLPLQKNLRPGETLEVTIGILTLDDKNQPLPEGDYELRWDVLQGDQVWLCSAAGIRTAVTVKIAKPSEISGKTLSVEGSVLLKTGSTYNYTVRVRNEGPDVWKMASDMSVGCRLYRMSSYVHGEPDDETTEVPIKSSSVPLPKDVSPGEVVTVQVPITFSDASGNPLPVWTQQDTWYYVSAWGIKQGQNWLPANPLAAYTMVIDVLDNDYGVQFEVSNAPQMMEADKTYDVRTIATNKGVETWTPAQYSLGYHWYYLDGTEAIWDGKRKPIRSMVRPGDKGVFEVKVTPPPYDGQYNLVLDLADGEKWISTSSNSKTQDILVTPVTVTKGQLAFADLSKEFDTAAATFDTAWSSGDFDGQGHTLPAEFLPPEVSIGGIDAKFCPSGYLWKFEGSGLEANRRIAFKLADKSVGQRNAVSCKGQTLTLPTGAYSNIHLLAAASAQSEPATFGLVYRTDSPKPSEPFTIAVWDTEPSHTGLAFLHRHKSDGDERGVSLYLGHYSIQADPSNPLTAIQLPSNPAIEIFAVTLEKAK